MEVDYSTYKTQQFTCNKCGWQAMGAEFSHSDFSEYSFIGNLDCPKCYELVAFWQAPLIDKKGDI